MLAHVLDNLLRDFLIKSTQRNRSNRHRRVKPKRGQEPSGFERDVRRAHAQRLPRRLGLGKNIVARDATFLRPRRVGIRRSSSHRDDHFIRRDHLFLSILFRRDDRILILKPSVRVHVRHVLLSQRRAIPEIQRPDVVLNLFHHLPPIVPFAREFPPVLSRIAERLSEDPRLVHELLRDASHVHARAAESPRRPRRARLDEVQTHRFRAVFRRFFRRGEPAGATADDDDVVLVPVVALTRRLRHRGRAERRRCARSRRGEVDAGED